MFIWIEVYNNWHNLLKQFPHISPTNFPIFYQEKYYKRKQQFLEKCNFFGQACFVHPGKQVFEYPFYIFPSSDITN